VSFNDSKAGMSLGKLNRHLLPVSNGRLSTITTHHHYLPRDTSKSALAHNSCAVLGLIYVQLSHYIHAFLTLSPLSATVQVCIH